MKYTLLAAGLLFSMSVCADDMDDTTSTTPPTGIDSVAVQKLFHPACQAFCESLNQNVVTCEVRANGGISKEDANIQGASAWGKTVSIDYHFTCTPTPP